jgi:hypothetical protein
MFNMLIGIFSAWFITIEKLKLLKDLIFSLRRLQQKEYHPHK